MQQFYLKDHLEKLYPFKICAELGSFTAASNMLNVSQPTLSVAIRTLEDILETPLFERKARGINLTEQGKILYEYSKSLFQHADGTELKIKSANSQSAGIIRISTHETLATHVWPKLIAKVKKSYPDLQVSLFSGRVDSIINDILNSNVDLALTVSPNKNPKLVIETLYKGEMGIYVAAKETNLSNFPVLKKSRVKIEDLTNIPLLTDTQAHTRQGLSISQCIANAGIQFNNVFSVNSFETSINLAAEGLGYAVLPKRNVQAALSSNKLRELKITGVKKLAEYEICATYLKSTSNNMVELFVEQLKEQF